MTKNLEELTSNWQDEKLDDGLYYIRLENGKAKPPMPEKRSI